MFLDGLPQTLTPLGLGGAGAADVQAGLRKTLRAVLDVQARSRRRRLARQPAPEGRSLLRVPSKQLATGVQ